MSCYNPLKAFGKGLTKDGKTKYVIVPYEVKFIDKFGVPVYSDIIKPDIEDNSSFFEIPCGHCLGCREDQAREWASRLIMEMQYYDSAYFITLTYDDSHIHSVTYIDDESGEVDINYTLNKRDCQLFFKRLRSYFHDDKIRYYLAGEYGEKTNRPHYHAIIFGLHLPEDSLIPCGISETGKQYYTCQLITDIWPNGFISIEPANYATCKYTAAYVTKKLGIKPNKVYEDKGIEPPFSIMSRKPGIGYQFLVDHKEQFIREGKVDIAMKDGSYRVYLPRYFYKIFEDDLQEDIEKMKAAHMAAAVIRKENIQVKLNDFTDEGYLRYLDGKEQAHKDRLKARGKI